MRFDEAIGMLDRGISIDPTSWQAHFEIGKAQVSKGDYLAGLRSLDKAQTMCNDCYQPLHLAKAHAMLALRRYEEAMAELEGFLQKDPKDPQSAAAREMMDKARALMNSR
jgi:tetratricopeptide (TPR) repeat protein